ncbi:MAG: succinate dehydrogenase, cytochrome b556 subunit [Thiohalocapsa sp.]|nr:succinate dehydrogenase, cytochrome b556 subunit [Thiohalocapsa sp.]
MTTNRPVFLEVWRIRLPIPGVVSILHRVSGVLMILAIPVMAALLASALSGPQGFAAAAAFLAHPLVKLALLLLGWALLHHLFAGIRYLIIDMGFGVDRPSARKSAWTALSAALVVAVIGGGVLL